MNDEFHDRVFDFLDATSARWVTLDARHAEDVALDISGPDDPFEGANIEHLSLIVGEWFALQGRP
jgi:hypothetical protein